MKLWTRHLTVIILLCGQFLIANVFASTILGTGTAALLGGDLSDPANTLDNTAGTTTASAIPGLWVSAAATTEPGFSPAEGNERAFDIFDNTVGSGTAKWCCSPAPQSMAIELYDQYVLTHFTIASGNDVPSRDPDIWSIEGSNDGVNWTPIYSYNNEGTSPFTQRFQVIRFDGNGADFATPAAYRWFRYDVTSTVANGGLHQINEIELFGDNYTIGGSVTGLAGSGLVLQNNGADDLSITADGNFTFATPQAGGTGYDVTVATQPTALNQTCTVTDGTGTVAAADIINVSVTCVTETYTIGGNVTGLAGSGLVLQNNGVDDLSIAADGSFTFATPMADGSGYAVTVANQPTALNQICTVTDGAGTLAGADISNVSVTCVTETYTIGGNVAGLAGSGLVLQNNGVDDLIISADGIFTFATPLVDGSGYAVTVATQPTALNQICTVTDGAGTLAGADISNVSVTCVTETYTIGGNITGLAGSGLVLQNNGVDDLSIAADGSFTFATPMADGSGYAVTVATQPTAPNQTCTVTDGTGTLAGTDISTVSVDCVTNTYTIGGSVTGLAGFGLVLQNNGADDLNIAADGSFTFATPMADGSGYAVTVSNQPTAPSQACTVTNGTGTLAGANITDVFVDCITATPVPTLSVWGIGVLAGLLGIFGFRRRRAWPEAFQDV